MSLSEGRPGPSKGRSVGWLFLDPDHVPETLATRAKTVAMIPLVEGELAGLLRGELQAEGLEEEEAGLAALVAQGLSTPEIARRLEVSERSVERRLAHLRTRLGLSTKAELASYLAERGFSR